MPIDQTKSIESEQSAGNQPDSLRAVLAHMHAQGRFSATFLTSRHGLPMVVIAGDQSRDVISANAALLQRISTGMQDQLGMPAIDEVTIYGRDRTRLVCRPFSVNGDELILAVVVGQRRNYRQLTNRAIRQIQRLMAESGE